MFFSATALFTEFNSSSHAESASTELSVRLLPALSMRIAKDVNGTLTDITDLDLNITPNAAGAFTKDNLSVLVSTNGTTGYTLSIANDDTDTSMHHTNTAITTTIPSITTDGLDESSFTINSWGYSLGNINDANQTFSAIPASTSPTNIKVTSAPAQDSRTDVTFATKINTAVSSGTYKDTIVFSAVTNYIPNALESISTMQQMTPQVCKQANIGDQATLTDTRDNKTYNIRKMEDGKCWMVQNLALGGSQAITLTPADSNVTANFTLSATSNSFGTTNDAAGININRMHDNGNTWIDSSNTVQTSGTPPSQTQYIGNYYNWYTATAGTGTYEMSTDGANATSSICPKGWRLPTGGSNGDLKTLYDAYGNHNSFMTATSAVLSGFWRDSSTYDQAIYGNWWSSTAYSATNGYRLSFSDTVADAQHNYYKRSGVSVRCVAEDDLTTISTMQQMTSSICANTATPAVADTTVPQNTLKDVRDGNTYVVRKLADGNCWMSQNLNLTLSTSTALNSTTSDLSDGRTWTPQNNTQTAVGTAWAADGGDVARSMDPGNIYFPGGVGTGTADADNNLQGAISGQPWEHVGNYYNWYAATAGTGTTALAVDGDVATDSVCPRGWRLPNNTGDKSFLNLISTTYGIADDATGVAKPLEAPLNFVRSGLYYYSSNGKIEYKGVRGYYWSATAQSDVVSYRLYTSSTQVNPQSANNKGFGFTVRCVAR